MTHTIIHNVRVVQEQSVLELGWVVVQNDCIIAIGSAEDQLPELPEDTVKLDGAGAYLVPGFIDIHVHGGAGEDFMTAKQEELDTITRFHMENGTTAMLATTVTGANEHLTAVIDAVQQYQQRPMPYAQLVGVHLEGPFVNPKWKGAQNESYMIEPQLPWLEAWVKDYPGIIKMQTLAPEINGAPAYIKALSEAGIVAALGHTDAHYADVQEAVKSGLTHAVHTFNAMRGLHHREPGTVGAVLTTPGITAEIIADGEHVHPVAVQLMLLAKGVDGIVLVTDAMSAAGMPDGEYMLGELPVVVTDNIARLKDGGSLAGSTLTMIRGFQFLIRELGISVVEASRIASLNPAKVIGLDQQYGSIAVGKRADLLLLDGEFAIQSVIIGGEVRI
ncbi:N-acetylglucosamine-6-phosphate deacetylase [Paenibacillus sp. FSL W7-1287]|uniref:N-acetylglucosamine-6-phosphate deacetylase n=1 Tax=Paenibacillus sp. FSL W7-1287 TaxID=2954538 RepID=UPI0030F625D0